MTTVAPPGPGSWSLDAAHCERPHSRFFVGLGFDRIYTEGLRASAERYGLMIDTIEARFVEGFLYTSPRAVGAPPGASTPPRWVLWLLCRVHPPLRARVARTDEVLRTRVWQQDVDHFRSRHAEAMRARCLDFQRTVLATLDDAALLEELGTLAVVASDDLFDHFRLSGACILPVGDFLAHAVEWTGCTVEEALALLTGASPDSVDAVVALDAAAGTIRADAAARAALEAGGAPHAVLTALRNSPTVGPAVHAWLELVSERIVTGHDIAELRAIELPGTLVDALRERVTAGSDARSTVWRPGGLDGAADRAAAPDAGPLRARVPDAHHADFDALLADARAAHPLRDARSSFDFWCMGLLRRVVLEVGRRLVQRGLLHAADHAVDCTQDELRALLQGGSGPSADQVAAWVQARRARSCADMPDVLGPPPAPPPPPEWFPPSAARIARAFGVYLDASLRDRTASADHDVLGIAAAPGIARGTARVVRSPDDFARVQQGDVLVARITTPSYNVLLPLLSAVVTERGGALSHPAIVSREYGLPAVVGARGALERIPDGALVEVDGNGGRVRVLP
jgi:phosphohistidine swiveling domain-containing protein